MVKNRNPLLVVLFSLITFGIYPIYWLVSTTLELKEMGKDVLTPWLLLATLIPVVNLFVIIFYMWKYCSAVEEVSDGNANKFLLLVLYFVFFPVTMYLVQVELNKKA